MTVASWMDTLDQIDALLPECSATLNEFYDTTLGFTSRPGGDRLSAVSHSLAVETVLMLPIDTALPHSAAEARVRQWHAFTKAGFLSSNSDLPGYEATFALPVMCDLLKSEPSLGREYGDAFRSLLPELKKGVDAVVTPSGTRSLFDYAPMRHGMILYRLRRALAVYSNQHVIAAVKLASGREDALGDVEETTQKLDRELEQRLYYFLSMVGAIPGNHEDALQLAYIIYALRHFALYSNDVLTEFAVRLTVESLFASDTLPRLQTVHRKGTDINISASPVEVLALLSCLDYVRERFAQFSPYFGRVYESLRATKRLRNRHPIWMAEPWRGAEEPEAWLNAIVIQFLVRYRDVLRDATAAQVEIELGASRQKPSIGWADIIDYENLKGTLSRFLIEKPSRSSAIILYGPPGTSKTSIAKAVAYELKMPYVELLAHDFAEEGTDGVIKRMREIFRRLLVLKECVVLLDEIDELVTSRSAEAEKIGRFITTSALPWLQRLRDRGRIIVFVATNDVSRFDPAIKRPGRFDAVLPVGPPNETARTVLLERLLMKHGLAEGAAELLAQRANTAMANTKVRLERPGHGDGLATTTKEYPWPATIGELVFVAERLTQMAVLGPISDSTLSDVMSKIAAQALIQPEDWWAFQDQVTRYRYPPVL